MSRRFGTLVVSMLFIISFAAFGTGLASAQEEDASGLSCSPEDPPPTATLSCQADGLQADSAAQWSAQFAGGSTDSGEATADANGTAKFQVEVPDEEGEYTVTLDGTAADGSAYSESFSGEVRAQGPDDDDDADEDCPEGEGNGTGDGNGEGDGDGDDDGEASDDCPDDEGDQDDDNGEGEGEEGQGQEKISLCHATASATNPYVFITVGAPAATKGGHANHEDDIIPADGPEDCPFGEEVLSCVSTAGVGSQDDNPIYCRVIEPQADQGAEFEAKCPDGSTRTGQVNEDGQGDGRFEFACPTGDFEVMVLGAEFEASAAGVAGVFFADDEAAPAPPPQVEDVPVGPVAAGYGGTAEPDRTGAIVALGVLAGLAALSTARLSRRVGSSTGRK